MDHIGLSGAPCSYAADRLQYPPQHPKREKVFKENKDVSEGRSILHAWQPRGHQGSPGDVENSQAYSSSAQNVPKRIQNNQMAEAAWKPCLQDTACLLLDLQLSYKTARVLWLASGIASKWDKPCLTCAGLRSLCVEPVGGMCWLVNSTQVNIWWVIFCWTPYQHQKCTMLLARRARNPGLPGIYLLSASVLSWKMNRGNLVYFFFGSLKGGMARAACRPCWAGAKSGRRDPVPGYIFERWKTSKASLKYNVWV